MGRLTYIEEVLRRIINDPNTSTEERRKAANQLQKAQDRARAARKARRAAKKASEPATQYEAGWQIDHDWDKEDAYGKPWTAIRRAAFRAQHARDWARTGSDLSPYNSECFGGYLTSWEKEQGRKILAGEVKPVAFFRYSQPDQVCANIEDLPPAKDEFDFYEELFAPLPS